jgi:hypothetical protein
MLHVSKIKVGVGPFQLENVFLQNGSIKNTKPKAQIQNH